MATRRCRSTARPAMPAACADTSGVPPIRIVPFEPAHLLALEMGAHERRWLAGFDIAACAAHWPPGPAWSAVAGATVLGCAGLTESGDTATAWAALSDDLRARPMALYRATSRRLDDLAPRYWRIRACLAADFTPGVRWLRGLGFRPVRTLAGYGPNGETFVEYERWQLSKHSPLPSQRARRC